MSGITKCDKLLLQSAPGIGKCDSYYKVHQLLQSVTDCYYKVHLVLQSVAIITKWDVTHVMLSEKEIWIGQKKKKKLCKHFPVSPMKFPWYWSSYTTYTSNFCQTIEKHEKQKKKKKKEKKEIA